MTDMNNIYIYIIRRTAFIYTTPPKEENSWEDLGFYAGDGPGPPLSMTITVMLPRVVKSSSSPLPEHP
jgi:hypothetical protein